MDKKLVGKKVIIRSQRKEDADFFTYWFNKPDVMFKCGFTEPTTVEKEVARIEKAKEDSDWYTITDLEGRVIGETGLLRMWPVWHCTDLSIMIPNPEDQGHGYGSEAISIMFELAFEKYEMNRIAIGVVAKNTYALDFYKRVGFKKEGIQEQGYYYEGEYSDFIMMRILRNEWLELIDSLTVSKNNFREVKTIDDLNKANKKLTKLTDRDVRIVYLPPMTLATIHSIGQDANGEHAEHTTNIIIDEFIKNTNLEKVYPAARHFGFNNPDGVSDDDPNHGYERWVSIPDDMEVPAPLVKKRLNGGMYAARVIPIGAWNEGWEWLHEWVANSENYDFRWETIDGVCGWLEEHLNYWNWYVPNTTQQVDLLMPIIRKTR